MKKDILMVAYDYPPIGGSGVQRTLKFSKYLPTHGWVVRVLTVRESQSVIRVKDASLLKEIPKCVTVHRSNLVDPYDNVFYRLIMGGNRLLKSILSRLKKQPAKVTEHGSGTFGKKPNLDFIHSLMVPDRVVGWLPFAVIAGIRVIRRQRPSLIYSTSPCETAHLAALTLSWLYKVPLVTDFRDPWTEYYFSLKRPRLFDALNKALEKKVLAKSSLVVSTADECSESLYRIYPKDGRDKFITITNGYDESDFSGVEPFQFDRFTLIFTGTVYRQVTPENVFKALQKLMKENMEISEAIQFVFVGDQFDGFDELVAKHELENIVKLYGYQSHRDSISFLMGADLCYYNVFSDLAITGKLYEYLRSGTRILATIPHDHSAAKIIDACDAGYICDYAEVDKIQTFILDELQRHQESRIHGTGKFRSTKTTLKENVARFDRRELSRRLSEALDCIQKDATG